MGISKYDVKQNHFINYYVGDGLQGNEFTHGAFLKIRPGKSILVVSVVFLAFIQNRSVVQKGI